VVYLPGTGEVHRGGVLVVAVVAVVVVVVAVVVVVVVVVGVAVIIVVGRGNIGGLALGGRLGA